MGSVCGMTPLSPPAEVFLKTLPAPKEVNPKKYERFEREEGQRKVCETTNAFPQEIVKEPFYDFVRGASGHKHVVLLLSEGNLVTFGDNTHGQTAAPLLHREHSLQSISSFTEKMNTVGLMDEARAPLYIDMGSTLAGDSSAVHVACGSNFSIVYVKETRRVICFGSNTVGQLGLGHKNVVDPSDGFETWDPLAAWFPDDRSVTVRSISCGFNHSIVQLTNGSLYAFGSNTWGELGIGSTTSPVYPTRILFFEERGIHIKKVALGNSFTLFLTTEGRVYGCGATEEGQLPRNAFEPVPIVLGRHFVRNSEGKSCSDGKVTDHKKLIRIKDIATVGSIAAYLTHKSELLVQGGLRDYGFSVQSPRLLLLSQDSAQRCFAKSLGVGPEQINSAFFSINSLQSGPQTLLLHYQNGCVGGFGANAEGELLNKVKVIHGKEVNVADVFSFNEIFPVWAPTSVNFFPSKPWFVLGKGFSMFVDNHNVLPLKREGAPIELPSAFSKKASIPSKQRMKSMLTNKLHD